MVLPDDLYPYNYRMGCQAGMDIGGEIEEPMPQFSKRSLERLNTCHPDLQRLMHAVIQQVDIIVLCGHRGEAEQNAAYKAGNSKLRYPDSYHNKTPSMAVDISRYPLDWNDIEGFKSLIAFVKLKAAELGIAIECGADWKMRDYPHIQIAKAGKV